MKSSKSKNVFLIIIAAVMIAYLAGTGIYDLINTKDRYTLQVDQAAEILEVEHSINGLIPIGKDHYYFAANGTTKEACIVKASTGWFKKNFDANGASKTAGGITVTALAKRADYKVADELRERVSQVSDVSFIVSPDYSLVLAYRFFALSKLLVIVLGAIIGIMIYRIAKSDDEVNPAVKKGFLLMVVAWLVFFLIVMVKGR